MLSLYSFLVALSLQEEQKEQEELLAQAKLQHLQSQDGTPQDQNTQDKTQLTE